MTAVLCPHSPDRLMALFTVLAADGAALPLCADTPSPALVHLLTATETRMVIADASLAGTALQLADRSRVRQVLAFGRVPGTTPFDELLLPGPAAAPDALAADIAGPPSGARGGRAEGALLDHRLTGGRLRTVLHTRADLLRRRAELQRDLDLGAADTVALDPLTPERDRIALTAAALWSGASVSTIAGSENPPEATVRSSPPRPASADRPAPLTPGGRSAPDGGPPSPTCRPTAPRPRGAGPEPAPPPGVRRNRIRPSRCGGLRRTGRRRPRTGCSGCRCAPPQSAGHARRPARPLRNREGALPRCSRTYRAVPLTGTGPQTGTGR
ncbi:hypothetical protein ACFQXA_16335 [Nocardiopsis composta]